MAVSRRLNELSAGVREKAWTLPTGGVVVALSGGADSACAAWLASEHVNPCRAIHVDHGLPGSPGMRSAARAIAERLGIDLDIVNVSIPEGSSPEGQARSVRYQALLEQLREGESLITGHTSDDQAETVLMNVLRGTGLAGLAGIPPVRDRIVRPILNVSRAETRELTTLLGLPWRDDPANSESDPRRNQIRSDLIPHLEARFNPQLRKALTNLAEVASGSAASIGGRVQTRVMDSGIAVSAPELYAVGKLAASFALREALRWVRGPHAGSKAEISRLYDVADGRASSVELTGGVTAVREGPWLVLSRDRIPDDLVPVTWRVPGDRSHGDWLFESSIAEIPPSAYPLSGWRGVMDADLVDENLEIRGIRQRDAIDGIPVVEVLRKAGVAVQRRPNWPVVTSEGVVVWVPGGRLSRSVWVGTGTRRYLWVQAGLETM